MLLPMQSQSVNRSVARRARSDSGITPQACSGPLCVTGTVQNNQLCINVPVFGQACFPGLPSWLNGQSVSVCYSFPATACLCYQGSEIVCI